MYLLETLKEGLLFIPLLANVCLRVVKWQIVPMQVLEIRHLPGRTPSRDDA